MPMVLTACPDDSTSHGLRSVLVRMPSLPQGEGVWGSWTTLRHSVLERLGVEMKTSARHCKKLSTCCTAVMPRMSFSSCYTLSTPLVEGAGKVFRSVTAVTIFWLALAKVGSSPPPRSWSLWPIPPRTWSYGGEVRPAGPRWLLILP
jgi:hypothetical protein